MVNKKDPLKNVDSKIIANFDKIIISYRKITNSYKKLCKNQSNMIIVLPIIWFCLGFIYGSNNWVISFLIVNIIILILGIYNKLNG